MENKRNYQAVFILNTRNQEESAEDITNNLKEILKSLDAEVLGENTLGRLEYARVLDANETSGHYVGILFAGAPTTPAALQEKLRLDKRVKRVIVLSEEAAVAN